MKLCICIAHPAHNAPCYCGTCCMIQQDLLGLPVSSGRPYLQEVLPDKSPVLIYCCPCHMHPWYKGQSSDKTKCPMVLTDVMQRMASCTHECTAGCCIMTIDFKLITNIVFKPEGHRVTSLTPATLPLDPSLMSKSKTPDRIASLRYCLRP